MGFEDYLIAGFFLFVLVLLIYVFASAFRDRSIRFYFITGAYVKLFGGFAFAMIHYYYYGGGLYFYGDTALYYRSIEFLNNLFFEQPLVTLKIIFSANNYEISRELFYYTSKIFNYSSDAEFFVIRVGTILSLFTLNNYIVISFIFGLFCFWGQWKIYSVFIDLYPNLKREIAIATLFIPSVIFWGSGVIKDPLTMGALGFVFSSLYNLFIKRKKLITSSIFLLLGVLILIEVKKYILIAFLPAAIVWVFYTYASNIKNQVLKILFFPTILTVGIVFGFSTIDNLTSGDPIYDLEDFGRRAKINSDYLYYVSQRQSGSAYFLGDLDGSLESTLSLAPSAIVVTLYRPFLWEVNNATMFLSAIESLLFLVLTLYTLLKVGLFKSAYIILKSPLVQFCLVFSIIFAFAIGITTFNFGSLVRYKIPLIPFYLTAMLLILNNYRIKELN